MYRHSCTSILVLLSLAFMTTLARSAENDKPADGSLRQWTDTTGKFQMDAELLDYKDGKVRLRRDNGQEVSVSASRLSPGDRAFIREELRRRKLAGSTPDADSKPAPGAEPEEKPDDEKDRSRGLGILPLDPPRTYVHVEGDPPPKPEDAVRCRYADPDKDPAPLVEAEVARLKTGNARHFEWEQKIGYDLVRVDTHHIVVHARLSREDARRVGMALEALKNHLQDLTGNMVLTPLRPDVDEIVIVFDKFQYEDLLRVIEKMYPGKLGENWHLMKEVVGGTVDRTSFSQTRPGFPHPAHMSVFQAGGKSIRKATDSRAPHWLVEGFAAYCEHSVLRQNLVHSVRYEVRNVLIGNDWLLSARRLAARGELKPWDDMFTRDLMDYSLIHYVEACAMVAYLLESDPQKFLDFADEIKLGRKSKQALEAAYGVPVEELEEKWLAWLKRRG